MMTNQIFLSNLKLEARRQVLVQNIGNPQFQEFQVQLLFRIAHSFGQSQKKVFAKVAQQSSELCFQRQVCLLSEKEDKIVVIQVFIVSQQNSKTFSKSFEVKQLLQHSMLQLDSQPQQNQKIRISYNCRFEQRRSEKTLSIINPKCQLMKGKLDKQIYLLEMGYSQKIYRTSAYNASFFWQDSLKMAIKDGNNTAIVNLVDSKQRRMKVYELNVEMFKRKIGSKKIMLFNQNKCPIGCIQFDYQTTGFTNLQREELIPQQYTSEIFKIRIEKIKGKFKEQTSQISIKFASNISNVDTEKMPVSANGFESDFGKHIYSQQSKCMLIVASQQKGAEVIGYATFDLMMVGKFEKRVPINHSETKAVMGHLFLGLEVAKKPAKSLILSAICLKVQKIDEKDKDGEVMLSARMGCCFGKTQPKGISSLVNFVKKLEVRYYAESTLYVNVLQTVTDKKLQIGINLSQLESKISGKYQKQFGTQSDFIKGTVSFQYSYDDHEKLQSHQKKLIEETNDTKRDEAKPQIPESVNKTKSIKQNQAHIPQQQKQTPNKIADEESRAKVLETNTKSNKVLSLQNPPVLNEEKNHLQDRINKQEIEGIPRSQQQQIKHKQEVKVQIFKKTPKQALLQSSLQTYLLENHIHQYQKPYRRMKSRKKKAAAPALEQSPTKNVQNGHFKRSSSKMDPIKRYQFVANVYLANRILGQSKNTGSFHKNSNSSKLTQFSLKKPAQTKNQPQLPKITAPNGYKKGPALDVRLIARKSISKLTKN